MNKMLNKEIKIAPKYILNIILISIILSVIWFGLYLTASYVSQINKVLGAILMSLSAGIGLFFGEFVVNPLITYLFKYSYLTISDKGIYDYGVTGNYGLIPWELIEDIKEEKNSLVIKISDIDKFLTIYNINKVLGRTNLKYTNIIKIKLNKLDISDTELSYIINSKLNQKPI